MFDTPRIAAAALLGCTTAGLCVVALATAAPDAPRADVTLQVAPRGPGAISADPAGVDSDDQPVTEPCSNNEGQASCKWKYPAGTKVRLTAKPESGKSFSGWSTPDCPGAGGSCTVTLDQVYTTIVGTFNPLKLGVRFSSDGKGRVTSDPAGIDCTADEDENFDQCVAEFPAHATVKLTATPDSGHSFNRWIGACRPADARTCTVVVDDHTTWAGVIWDKDSKPNLATTIDVLFQLRKGGNGAGRITGQNLDCGGACTRTFGFGTTITLTAAADAGSTFDGWNGVCSKSQASCTFAVGPITSLRASFARDTSPPSSPGDLRATSTTRTGIAVSWSASTDNVGVAGYRLYLNDTSAGDTKETQFAFANLVCGRSYRIAVDAADAVGNRSARTTLDVGTQLCALAARLAGVSVPRGSGTRTVVVKLRVNRVTTARLKLVRGSLVVASGRYAVKPGTNTLRLRVSGRAPGGAYRLSITLANPDGGTIVLPSRGTYLPRPR